MQRGQPPYQNLVMWQQAQSLAVELVEIVDALPAMQSARTLGNQLLRSGASVAANIAEGYGRFSDGAYRNHLSIARGSLFETESWLNLLMQTGHITTETSGRLTDECEEIARMLTAAMRPLRRANERTVREQPVEYYVTGSE